jgi:hypothetical protein
MDINARHVAGRAAIAAAACYLLQPVVVALGGLAGAEDQDFLLPSQVRRLWWSGAIQGSVLLAVGLSLLVLVVALDVVLPDNRLAIGRRVARILGIVGAVGWLSATATGIAGYSTVAAFLAESGADEGAQKAALHMVNVMVEAGLALSAIGVVAWLAWLSVSARRAGLIGGVLSVAGLVVAALTAGTTLVGFPIALLLLIPYLPCLGVRLIRTRPLAPSPAPV